MRFDVLVDTRERSLRSYPRDAPPMAGLAGSQMFGARRGFDRGPIARRGDGGAQSTLCMCTSSGSSSNRCALTISPTTPSPTCSLSQVTGHQPSCSTSPVAAVPTRHEPCALPKTALRDQAPTAAAPIAVCVGGSRRNVAQGLRVDLLADRQTVTADPPLSTLPDASPRAANVTPVGGRRGRGRAASIATG
jgi:hypothetical protein